MPEFRITKHVRDMLADRRIDESIVLGVLDHPEQIVAATEGNLAYQSRVKIRVDRFSSA